jgi:hypothetical protein
MRVLLPLQVWCVLLPACTILAPLDDVVPTASDKSTTQPDAVRVPRNDAGTRSRASGSDASRAGDDPARKGDPDVSMTSEDAGRSEPVCHPTGKSVCHAAKQCGCAAGEHCGLDDAATGIACIANPAGPKGRGEPCERTSECMAGLQCPEARVCSAYCDVDGDCAAAERCVPFETKQLMLLEGTGACQKVCDPVSGEPCTGHERCVPTVEARPLKLSLCTNTQGVALTPRGDSCHDSSVACEPKTACARFGPEVCAPICRTDRDCPAELPHCYIQDRLAAVGDRLGDCWVSPCDDATVPELAAWAAGPIATQAQLSECRGRCGMRLIDDLSCVRTRCAPGLERCLGQASRACAAAKGESCRALQVAASCSDWLTRIGAQSDFETCVAAHARCAQVAQDICAGSVSGN